MMRRKFPPRRGTHPNYITTVANLRLEDVPLQITGGTAPDYQVAPAPSVSILNISVAEIQAVIDANFSARYSKFKVMGAVYRWKVYPTQGATPGLMMDYKDAVSWYTPTGLLPFGVSASEIIANPQLCLELPFAKKHNPWFGSKRWFPALLEKKTVYGSVNTDAATFLVNKNLGGWLSTENVEGNATYKGPGIYHPGVAPYGSQQFTLTGDVDPDVYFKVARLERTVELKLAFKGHNASEQGAALRANAPFLNVDVLNTHNPRKAAEAYIANKISNAIGVGDIMKRDSGDEEAGPSVHLEL